MTQNRNSLPLEATEAGRHYSVVMTNPLRILILVLVAVLPLTACQTPVVRTLPELTFGHLPVIKLAVSEIRVESRYRPAMRAPWVDHQFTTPPDQVMQRWGKDRLAAVGGRDVAVFTVVDAGVREVRLKTTQGVRGVFTKDQSERYEARLEAKLEIYNGHGLPAGHASAVVTRNRTIAEDASLNDRERLWFEMTEALMQQFDMEMEARIRGHLGAWVQ